MTDTDPPRDRMIEVSDLRHAIAALGAGNPQQLTARLLAQEFTHGDLVQMLRWTLPNFVRHALATPLDTITTPNGETAPRNRHPGPHASRRVAAAGSQWQRLLRSRLWVSNIPGDYRTVGECTVDNVKHLAAVRHAKADQTRARAEKWEQLAELMLEHDVMTVAELPEDVGQRYLDPDMLDA